MNILLTGATGFLGTQVTRLLAEAGHTIQVLHRPGSKIAHIAPYVASFKCADLNDPIAVNDAAGGKDVIVHLAADLSHWSAHRDRIFRTNVMGTRIMAEAAKTIGVRRFVHVSSIATIGYSADGAPIDETAPNNFVPLGLIYHESKRLAELEAFDAIRYGVDVVVVNPGVLYGPRSLDHTFGHSMLELAANKIPGHPSGGLSVTDVDDAAAGTVAAVERGKSGERYILGGHNVTYAEIFTQQAQAVGAGYAGRELPAALLSSAARIFELRSRFTGKEPRLTMDNAKIAPLKMWYTSRKAQTQLGYTIRPLEATLGRMVAHYKKAGALP